MQQAQQHFLPNSRRFWGEEKNLDSIYNIYLKKISYSHNDGNSLTTISDCSKKGYDEIDSKNISTNSSKHDTLKTIASDFDSKSNLNTSSTARRSRQNFFQKYRRRSCSVDKYSFVRSSKESSDDIRGNNTSKTTLSIHNNGNDLSYPSQLSSRLKFNDDSSPSVSSNDLEKNSSEAIDDSSKNDVSSASDRVDTFSKSAIEPICQKSESQYLQWETRQIKVLQAATLDHVVKFILLFKPSQDYTASHQDDDLSLEEERNNVAHVIHVLFCSYRVYTNPYELMIKILDYSELCRKEQYRFVMQYWMDNYPEDFDYVINGPNNHVDDSISSGSLGLSIIERDSSSSNISSTPSKAFDTVDDASSNTIPEFDDLDERFKSIKFKVTLKEELARLCKDEFIKRRLNLLIQTQQNDTSNKKKQSSSKLSGLKRSSILDMDSRYVAQQLTAIDLENFLKLKPYTLLEGTKSDRVVQRLIKNFNLLSKQVIVTILKSHTPHFVAMHWIGIASNLKNIKNFNSLKAIIAGLTNESIHRLKNLIWNKLNKSTLSTFKLLASIVDDVNNQTVLRQTQLIVGGSTKMSLDEESFGTVPYLGTFLTDLTMIDARYPNYIPSPKDETSKLKLINFAKCARQFEILTQVQLLQKNVIASLIALQKRNYYNNHINSPKSPYSQAKPAIPQVSKLFENWFFDDEVMTMTDKKCYEISVLLDQNSASR